MQVDVLLCNRAEVVNGLVDIEGAGWEWYAGETLTGVLLFFFSVTPEDPPSPQFNVETTVSEMDGEVLYQSRSTMLTVRRTEASYKCLTASVKLDGIELRHSGTHRIHLRVNEEMERNLYLEVRVPVSTP